MQLLASVITTNLVILVPSIYRYFNPSSNHRRGATGSTSEEEGTYAIFPGVTATKG